MTESIYQMLLDFLHVLQEPDESTVRRITSEGNAGIALIRKYGDPDASCEPGTESGALLCEYVLRAESGAAMTFIQDFAQEVLSLRVETDVREYAEAMGYDQED